MVEVIGVRFRTAGKIYFFNPKEFQVKSGDHVIVETARGIEFGSVVSERRQVKEKCIGDELKPVLRIATKEDEERAAKNREKEKEAFEKVNGFDEDYKGELGKVDLCLKIRNKHMSVVYNPYVKVMRWSNELRNNENDEKLFKKQWAEILEKDDPYYNKNLSLSVSGCNIR